MAKRNEEEFAVGDDAFMDTIANLVGIMIILVVIVGSKGFDAARTLAREEVQDQMEQLKTPTAKAENLDRDVDEQIDQLQQYEVETAYRNAERMTLVDQKTLIDQEIQKRLEQLDARAKQAFEVDAQVGALERQFEELTKQQGELPEVQKAVIALQHLPTPMAKTVFGKELHVMIRDHQLSVIPWDTLVDLLKSSARSTASRNSQRDKFEDVLGPIDGFLMRYRLISKSGLMSDGRVAAMGKMVELERFELEETRDVLRESVEASLAQKGRLRAELDATRSNHTTVTVWVYPESFNEFRKLKEMLYKEGCLCAARPLPRDMRIGASPQGSSSTAQ
ncbi:MAG: hypothetical protein ACOYKN_09290 [Pirellula sp.]